MTNRKEARGPVAVQPARAARPGPVDRRARAGRQVLRATPVRRDRARDRPAATRADRAAAPEWKRPEAQAAPAAAETQDHQARAVTRVRPERAATQAVQARAATP